MTTLSSPKVLGDLVKWETHYAFCRDSGTIKNATGADTIEYSDPVGYPVSSDGAGGYKFTEVGDEANCIGLIMQGPKIPIVSNNESTPDEYLLIVRGPCLVNKDAIASDDIDGAGALDADAIQTALEALNFQFLLEPTEIETQTT